MVEILSPILSNLLVIAIIAIGFFVGRSNGFKLQLTKLILTIGAGIGTFFLTPVFINMLNLEASMVDFALVFGHSILFLAAYLIITAVIATIKHCLVKKERNTEKAGANKAKAVKHKRVNVTKKTKEELALQKEKEKRFIKERKREERLARKAARKAYAKAHKKSRIGGIICGVISAFVIIFTFAMPAKLGFAILDLKFPGAYKGYEYSISGLLDKGTDYVDNAYEYIEQNIEIVEE